MELASTSIDLAKAGEWKTTTFKPVRTGSQAVILETQSGSVPTSSPLSFHGQIEVEVIRPAGHTAFHSPAATISHTLATGLTWTLLGEFNASEVSGSWTMRVRTVSGDPTFAGTASRVYVKTPPAFDARWYQQRSRIAVALIATGGVVLLLISGFFYLVARRRKS
jgi:hypothetical protein